MDEDRQELLRQLFAEATVRLEAAHERAVAGQSAGFSADDYASAARRLRAAAHELAALADAARMIAEKPNDDRGDWIETNFLKDWTSVPPQA